MEEFINNFSPLSKLDLKTKAIIIKNAEKVIVPKWETIISNWSKNKNTIYLIKKGKISHKTPIKTTSMFSAWDIFWELPILTGAEKHIWNFVTEEKTELIKINKLILENLLNKPETQKHIQDKVMKKIIKNKSLFNK